MSDHPSDEVGEGDAPAPEGTAKGASASSPARKAATVVGILVAIGLGAVSLARAPWWVSGGADQTLTHEQLVALNEEQAVAYKAFFRVDPSTALESARRAIAIAPLHRGPWQLLTMAYLYDRQPAPAIDAATRSIELFPTSAAYTLRGTARRLSGDLPGAVADYDAAMRIMPDNLVALGERGLTRVELGEVDAGFGDLLRAVEIDQERAMMWVRLAEARVRMGDLHGALEDANHATAINPEKSLAWRAVAEVERRLGNEEAARAAAEKAEELRPGVMALWFGPLAAGTPTGRVEPDRGPR